MRLVRSFLYGAAIIGAILAGDGIGKEVAGRIVRDGDSSSAGREKQSARSNEPRLEDFCNVDDQMLAHEAIDAYRHEPDVLRQLGEGSVHASIFCDLAVQVVSYRALGEPEEATRLLEEKFINAHYVNGVLFDLGFQPQPHHYALRGDHLLPSGLIPRSSAATV